MEDPCFAQHPAWRVRGVRQAGSSFAACRATNVAAGRHMLTFKEIDVEQILIEKNIMVPMRDSVRLVL